ncbi:PAS domain S-box protein [Xanthomonas nasturtii]|uniref:PAS domain S-box protein n=1 Tax=Xanthomonas nasturtii TaxID=1843581 RepID=UPI0020133E61|nr:PAS domain S-box protein [Xanthomonas nasturtii]MCL1525295.1 PAS domain S-box protein [Xanthomonas nasturtii]
MMRLLAANRRALRWAVVVLALGAVLTTVTALELRQVNARRAQAQLAASAQATFDQIQELLNHYQYGLRGMRGVVLTAEEHLDGAKMLRYSRSRDLAREFRGARGFGVIRRVPEAEQARFVAAARAAGQPDFRIRMLTAHHGDRFVIQYIEPVQTNAAAVGLDIASESNRRQAALAAALSGEPRLTGPITLVQAGGHPSQSFLMLLPVYRGGATPSTPTQRRDGLVGWTYTPLLMTEVMQALRLDPQRLQLRLSDVDASGAAVPFYSNRTAAAPTVVASTWVQRDVMGRRWRLDMQASPAFAAAAQVLPVSGVLSIGLLLSVLTSALAGALCSGLERRRQAARGQADLLAVVQSSADSIIGKTSEGVVHSWNRAAEQLFGYSAEQAIGRRLLDLIVPEHLHHEEHAVLQRISRGEEISHFETVRRHADGRLLDVLVSVSPIRGADGRLIGASNTVRDISEQKAARAQILALNASLENQVTARTAELQRSTLMLEGVLSAASEVSIIATDPSGSVTLFNTGAERMLGYQGEEVVGRASISLFHLPGEVDARARSLTQELGRPVEGFRAFVEKAERDGADTYEWTYVRRDGSTRQVSLVVTAIRSEDNAIAGYLGIALDISERKAAERSLARSNAMTQAILDTAVNPIITIDTYGGVRSFNSAGERVFGYAASDVIGQNVRMLMPDVYAGRHDAILERYRQSGAGQPTGIDNGREALARRKDGSEFPVEISLGTMWVDGQRLVVGVIADITERHRQRQALTRARDQLAMAADAAELGIWTWIPGTDALECNARMCEMYEWPPSLSERGLCYSDWRCMVHPDDIDRTEQSLQAAMEGRGVYDPVFRVLRSDGGVLHIQAGAHTERDAEGRITRVIGINRDITSQLEAEQELRLAKARADEASEAKSSFLANMSHEIRTPMNAVLGMLQLLQRTGLDARQGDYAGKAQKAATSLLGLLNDILDYSKIEAGKLQLDPHGFRLEELLRDLSVVLSGNHHRPEVEIAYQLDQGIPDRLVGDSLRLQQVLINLAGNALKFTQYGHVLLRVELLAIHAQAVTLRVAVEDTGIGISAEQQQRIFHSFTQAETSISRRFGGTGLGLVISRRLIGLMGGNLQVDSTLGQGSRFWFDLQLECETPALQLPARSSDAARHLLLVDDSALVREVLAEGLVAQGWTVAAVASGEAAVTHAVEAAGSGRPFDVVLMDWRLPGMDGIAAATRIRERCGRHVPPAILMLTAYQRELLAEAQRHGEVPFVDHLVKPVTPRQVIDAIEQALRTDPPPVPVPALPQRLQGLRVLVVEDNALNRQIADELLRGEGAWVALAEDGEKGLQRLREGPGVDVVVMDMQMPHVDGLEATRRIRADARFAALPILAMTANAASSDVSACLEAGMDAHIGKPIDLERMVDALLRLSGRNAAAVPDDVQADAAPPDTIALDAVLARFGQNRALLARMLDTFDTDRHAMLECLHTALADNDDAACADAAHVLKGTSATLGADRLALAASALEQDARRGRLPAAATLDALAGLADGELRALREALAHSHSQLDSAAMAPADGSADTVRHFLDVLAPMLRASNLHALDLLAQAPVAIAGAQAARYLQFRQQVQQLQFDAALRTLDDLMEHL